MEENKITNEEVTVVEEEMLVETPAAEEPRLKKPPKSPLLKKNPSPMTISRRSRMTS